MFDLADLVPLTIQITDANKIPADAGDVMLTITLPDGTTTAPHVLHPSVGLYQVDYQPGMAGLHFVDWVATGVNSAAFSDSFDVRPAIPRYLVSLIDVKQYLNISTSTNDEELRGFIEAATDVIEEIVGPTIVKSVTETHTRPGRVLVLQQPPVVSLTSVTSVLAGGWDVDIATVDVDVQTGILRRLDGLPLAARPFPIRVTYLAGRPVMPASITMAAKVIIDHLWETQRGHTQGVRPSPGGGRGAQKKGPMPTLPHRALELLRPYRRAPAIF